MVQQSQNVSAAAVGDLDGDGHPEIVVTEDATFGAEVYGNVYAWHRNGSPVAGWPVDVDGSLDQPLLGDVNGDETLEIVVRHGVSQMTVFRADGAQLPGWPKAVGHARTGGFPCLGDLDGDGAADVVM